jgi:hypothetical protein
MIWIYCQPRAPALFLGQRLNFLDILKVRVMPIATCDLRTGSAHLAPRCSTKFLDRHENVDAALAELVQLAYQALTDTVTTSGGKLGFVSW